MARVVNLARTERRFTVSVVTEVGIRVLGSVVLVVGVTGLIGLAEHAVNPRNLEVLYILAVLAAAVLWGLAYALPVSVASALLFDWFYLPPTHKLFFQGSDVIGLTVLVVCALVVSELANRAHIRARVSEKARSLIAEEQAALRRVATLVAREVPTPEVFEAVAAEVGLLMGATTSYLSRFENSREATILSCWHREGSGLPVGRRFALNDNNVSGLVYATRRPQQIDYDGGHPADAAPGAEGSDAGVADAERLSDGDREVGDAEWLSEGLMAMGIRSAVGAPIVVGGRAWGAIVAGTASQPAFPESAVARLADFTELVSTAISNSAARSELAASRSRIVAAADAERRRIERDIHDGAQQRLVALALELRSAELSIPADQAEVRSQLDHVARELGGVLDELREISRGIHPSLLTDRGLKAALKSLARRSPVPVEFDATSDRRFSEAVEVAAYYVASEALVNASKHAEASVVRIELCCEPPNLMLRISDDGVGGADPSRGTGLVGLADRVGALGGRCTLSSPAGGGTTLVVELPMDRGGLDTDSPRDGAEVPYSREVFAGYGEAGR